MGLNRTLLFAFWVLVPLMTADCVSREKREGTLGLLFLTPLTVFDVIAGKAAIHVLRALTLFLAALPLLGLPLGHEPHAGPQSDRLAPGVFVDGPLDQVGLAGGCASDGIYGADSLRQRPVSVLAAPADCCAWLRDRV
jgi:ABC-type Na+ efflux pump permease subunit